jgi:hypothetical protein
MAAAQNMLMRKPGVLGDDNLQSLDFEKYLQMFRDGLTNWQIELILELFNRAPGMLECLVDITLE